MSGLREASGGGVGVGVGRRPPSGDSGQPLIHTSPSAYSQKEGGGKKEEETKDVGKVR